MVAISKRGTYAGLSSSIAYSYRALLMLKKNGGNQLRSLTVELADQCRQKRANL
jgi:hypothetical protein